jgi:hypothetical protein
MTDLLASLLRSAPFSPLARVEAFKRDPVGVQSHLLRRLLITAADTEWGRRFDFRRIAASDDVVEAYRRTVPLHSYDALSHDAERVRRGVPDVMWPGIHTHFAVSSGTASAGKLIPLSQDMLDVNKRFSVGAGLNYLAETGDFSFIFGKHLTLAGRIEESPDYPGTLVGEVSGLQAEHAPKFFSTLLQAVPNELSFPSQLGREARRRRRPHDGAGRATDRHGADVEPLLLRDPVRTVSETHGKAGLHGR